MNRWGRGPLGATLVRLKKPALAGIRCVNVDELLRAYEHNGVVFFEGESDGERVIFKMGPPTMIKGVRLAQALLESGSVVSLSGGEPEPVAHHARSS